MFQELTPENYENVRPLFEGFDYSLSILAALEGKNPGRIFVDDIHRPRAAFALTVEGYLLAGEHDNPEIHRALKRLLKERIFTGEVFVNGDWSMSLAVHPQDWEIRLPELTPTHEAVKMERYHYLCRALKVDWRAHLPEGYQLQRIDRALLKDPEMTFPAPLSDWFDYEEMWGSVDNFLANGVGFCILQGREVVAYCTSDCAAGNQIDVGIITAPSHRRQGLATLAVAATVEHCLSHGFQVIGWHCNAENVASWKTAEKVGFERNREYAYYYYVYDPIDHLAELGWYYFKHGDYQKTVAYYDRVFAQREDNPDYYYHLAAAAWAALGDAQKAIRFLHAAVDHGWAHSEHTRQMKEFGILHSHPEWETLLDRMRSAS